MGNAIPCELILEGGPITYTQQLRYSFDDLKFEVKLLTSKDIAQIKFPKLSREAQRLPVLIQISDEFKTQGTPEVSECHVCANRS